MEQYCYKKEDETLYLRGVGRLTAQNSEEFKNTVFQFLQKNLCQKIVLDLSDCQYMDSTFLGLLVGFYKKIRKTGNFFIVKPSREAMAHLHSMGIDKIINIWNDHLDFPKEMGNCSANPTKDPQTILKAHQNLMELSSDNAKKFALLASVLENTIAKNCVEHSSKRD